MIKIDIKSINVSGLLQKQNETELNSKLYKKEVIGTDW